MKNISQTTKRACTLLLLLMGIFAVYTIFGQPITTPPPVEQEEHSEEQHTVQHTTEEGFWIVYRTDDGIYQKNPITNEIELITNDTRKAFVKASVIEEARKATAKERDFPDGKLRSFSKRGRVLIGQWKDNDPSTRIPEYDTIIQIPNLDPSLNYEYLTWSPDGDKVWFVSKSEDLSHVVVHLYDVPSGILSTKINFSELYSVLVDEREGDPYLSYKILPGGEMFWMSGLAPDASVNIQEYLYVFETNELIPFEHPEGPGGNLHGREFYPRKIQFEELVTREEYQEEYFRKKNEMSLNTNRSSSFSFKFPFLGIQPVSRDINMLPYTMGNFGSSAYDIRMQAPSHNADYVDTFLGLLEYASNAATWRCPIVCNLCYDSGESSPYGTGNSDCDSGYCDECHEIPGAEYPENTTQMCDPSYLQNCRDNRHTDVATDYATGHDVQVLAIAAGVIIQLTTNPSSTYNSVMRVQLDDGRVITYLHMKSYGQGIVLGKRVVQGQFLGDSRDHIHVEMHDKGFATSVAIGNEVIISDEYGGVIPRQNLKYESDNQLATTPPAYPSITNYIPITCNETITGNTENGSYNLVKYGNHIASGPEDVYRLDLDAGESVEIEFTDYTETGGSNTTNLDCYVVVGDNPFTGLMFKLSEEDAGVFTNTIPVQSFPQEIYVIIDGKDRRYGDYQLNVSGQCTPACAIDPSDNTPQTATLVNDVCLAVDKVTTRDGCLSPLDSRAFWEVIPENDGSLHISVDATASVQIRLYGEIGGQYVPIPGTIDTGTTPDFIQCCQSFNLSCWFPSLVLKIAPGSVPAQDDDPIIYDVTFDWDYDTGCDPGFGPDESESSGFMPLNDPVITGPVSACQGDLVTYTISGGTPPYTWFGTTSSSPLSGSTISFTAGETTELSVKDGNCEYVYHDLYVYEAPDIAAYVVTPQPVISGETVILQASGGSAYSWSPCTWGCNSWQAQDIITESTTYTVTVTHGSCQTTATVDVIVDGQGPPISNPWDDPCDGKYLSLGQWISMHNVDATNTANPPVVANCDGGTYGDVWGRVTVPSSGKLVIDTRPLGISGDDLYMYLYTGNSCGNLSQLGCYSIGSSQTPGGSMPYAYLTGLTPGENVFLRLGDYNNNHFGYFQVYAYDPDPVTNGESGSGNGDIANLWFKTFYPEEVDDLEPGFVNYFLTRVRCKNGNFTGTANMTIIWSKDQEIDGSDTQLLSHTFTNLSEGSELMWEDYEPIPDVEDGTYWLIYTIEVLSGLENPQGNIQMRQMIVGDPNATGPDLTVESVNVVSVNGVAFAPGAAIEITGDVQEENEEETDTPARVACWLVKNADPWDDDFWPQALPIDDDDGIGKFDSGEEKDYKINGVSLPMDINSTGNWEMWCMCDSENDVPETNEGNNWKKANVYISTLEPALPDYIMEFLRFETEVAPGIWEDVDAMNIPADQRLKLVLDQGNMGTAEPTNDFPYYGYFYFSPDDRLSVDDVYWERNKVTSPGNNFPVGEMEERSESDAIEGCQLGLNYLIMVANSGTSDEPSLPEITFANDTTVVPFVLVENQGDYHDLAVEIISVSSISFYPGDIITVGLLIKNHGDLPVLNPDLTIFISEDQLIGESWAGDDYEDGFLWDWTFAPKPSLEPGEEAIFYLTGIALNVNFEDNGFLIAKVDSSNDLVEYNKENNTSMIPITIPNLECFTFVHPSNPDDPFRDGVYPYNGGGEQIGINTDQNCSWNLIDSATPWIQDNGGGIGNGYQYTSAVNNPSVFPRFDTIMTNYGSIYPVMQEGRPCNQAQDWSLDLPLPNAIEVSVVTPACGELITLQCQQESNVDAQLVWYQDGIWIGDGESIELITTDSDIAVRYENPCGFSEPQTLTLNPFGNIIVSGSLSAPLCDGTSALLELHSTEAVSYLWETGDTTTTLAIETTGAHEVTITDIYGCVSVHEFDITSLPDPIIDGAVTVVTQPTCSEGGSIAISVPGIFDVIDNQTGATYNDQIDIATISGILSGVGNVTIYQEGCVDTLWYWLTDPINNVFAYAEPGLGILCFEENTEVEVVGVGGHLPYSYLWHTGDTSSVATLYAGEYSVTVTDADGCTTSFSDTLVQPELYELLESDVEPATGNNYDGSVVVTQAGGTPPYSIEVYRFNEYIGTYSGPTIEGLKAGKYFLIATDSRGCQWEDAFRIFAEALPGLEIASEVIDSLHSGSSDERESLYDDKMSNDFFRVYPNPAKSLVTIVVTDQLIGKTLITSNVFGENINQQVITSSKMNLSIDHLSSGIYLMYLKDDRGEMYIQKVLVQ